MTMLLIVLLLWLYACGATLTWLFSESENFADQIRMKRLIAALWPIFVMALLFFVYGGTRADRFVHWLERRFAK